jgi:hypothetical protein
MKNNEKKIIGLAVVLFLVVIIVRVIPLLRDTYSEGLEEIAFMEQQIDRLRMLVEEAPFIKDEEALKKVEMAELENWVFSGDDANLIGTSVQQQLRQAVDEAGISPRGYDTPRIGETDGWIVVTQEMQFTINQEDILPFIEMLESSRPRLHVTDFSINRNRRQYTGSITVSGFSKVL